MYVGPRHSAWSQELATRNQCRELGNRSRGAPEWRVRLGPSPLPACRVVTGRRPHEAKQPLRGISSATSIPSTLTSTQHMTAAGDRKGPPHETLDSIMDHVTVSDTQVGILALNMPQEALTITFCVNRPTPSETWSLRLHSVAPRPPSVTKRDAPGRELAALPRMGGVLASRPVCPARRERTVRT